ncbi:MAG: hypothetical protein LC732_03900 [Acidobacteria bacterium]|nr:hypothetical protein [Acidobacteriota bacterium]
MRVSSILVAAAFLSAVLMAGIDPRTEYGKPRDLRDVVEIYLFTSGDEELAAEGKRQIAAALPPLIFVDQESESDLTLSVQRQMVPKEGEPGEMITAIRVARVSGKTIHLYLDVKSHAEGLEEAVAEVVAPFVNLMQKANARRFGVPGDTTPAWEKRAIHSTVGLRHGLTKKEVRAAIGFPTRIDGKGARTTVWIYATTDGDMRLVFAGDRLAGITHPKKD